MTDFHVVTLMCKSKGRQAHRGSAAPVADGFHSPDACGLQGHDLEVAACVRPILQHADHYVAGRRAVHLVDQMQLGFQGSQQSVHADTTSVNMSRFSRRPSAQAVPIYI